jgi:hypothetical protein
MKIATLLLLFVQLTCMAQEKPLVLDERGKLLYYEVLKGQDSSADVLRQRASDFLKSHSKTFKLNAKSTDSLLQASGKFILQKTALVLSRPSGEVSYLFNVETRAGKYRFWLSDFSFIPYQRDRYGNFVPETAIGIPMERKPGKLNAAEWDSYLKALTKETNAFAIAFKDAMKQVETSPAVKQTAPVISTSKW